MQEVIGSIPIFSTQGQPYRTLFVRGSREFIDILHKENKESRITCGRTDVRAAQRSETNKNIRAMKQGDEP